MLPAIRPRPGETSGSETMTSLVFAREYRAGEFAADRTIHMMGTLTGAVGSAILVGIAAAVDVLPTFSASLVYAICLVAMLGCSAAYNLTSNTSRREFLRQLDHAAIYLMSPVLTRHSRRADYTAFGRSG
jgi:predicted membrane channel-forming protein YqfA (hemolysin III family)